MNTKQDISKKVEDAEMKIIEDFVDKYRAKKGIVPTLGIKPEPSCIAFGEGHNLLYVQLINTINGYGGWLELKDAEVRELVLKQIERDYKCIE